jgi:hypothetical protein
VRDMTMESHEQVMNPLDVAKESARMAAPRTPRTDYLGMQVSLPSPQWETFLAANPPEPGSDLAEWLLAWQQFQADRERVSMDELTIALTPIIRYGHYYGWMTAKRGFR